LCLAGKGSVKVAAEAQGDYGKQGTKREPNGPRCYCLNESVGCHNADNIVAHPLPLQVATAPPAHLVAALILAPIPY